MKIKKNLQSEKKQDLICHDLFLTNVSTQPEDLVLAEERTTEADRELIMDGETMMMVIVVLVMMIIMSVDMLLSILNQPKHALKLEGLLCQCPEKLFVIQEGLQH